MYIYLVNINMKFLIQKKTKHHNSKHKRILIGETKGEKKNKDILQYLIQSE